MAAQPLLNGFANSAHDVMMGPAHESAEIFADQMVLETVTLPEQVDRMTRQIGRVLCGIRLRFPHPAAGFEIHRKRKSK